jgi:hypothetical protein
MKAPNVATRACNTLTEELQDNVRLFNSDAPMRSALEVMVYELSLRLLALKHGAAWSEEPVFPVVPR